MARHSSFVYRATSSEIREVGRQLGARYVVEGSARRIGKRVRVTVKLLDAASGFALWTERYDREIEIALELDETDAWSHGVFAQCLFLQDCDQEAETHFKRALTLNPNDADIAAAFANILAYWARWKDALTWIKSAKRLNPFPPNIYHWYHALALYSAREYEQAIKVLREARSSDRWSHALLAACYAQTDRLTEASFEARAFIRERIE